MVGFPSGADTTEIKVETARALLAMGCDELDMVINVGQLKLGHHDAVCEDIRAVVEAAGEVPVKSILEIAYLTDRKSSAGSKYSRRRCYLCETGTSWPQADNGEDDRADPSGNRRAGPDQGGRRIRKLLGDLEAMYKAGLQQVRHHAASALKKFNEGSAREGLALR